MSIDNDSPIVNGRDVPFHLREGLAAYYDSQGQPCVEEVFGPPANLESVQYFIEVAQAYLAKYSNDCDPFHDKGLRCRDSACPQCCKHDQLKAIEDYKKSKHLMRNKKVEAGFVYLVHANGLYKIGTSIKPTERIKSLKSPNGARIELLHAIRTNDRFALECYWHCEFAGHHAINEWFHLTAADIEEFQSYEAIEMEVAA